MTESNPTQHFYTMATLLDEDGEKAGDNAVFGARQGIPYYLSAFSIEPLSYLLKFRITTTFTQSTDWVKKFAQDHAEASLGCEIEDGYLWLWIRNAAVLTPQKIVDVAEHCIRYHEKYFPQQQPYCYACGNSKTAEVIRSNSSVSNMCNDCLEEKDAARKEEEASLNKTSGLHIMLLPAVFLISGLGWATFWFLYGRMFQALDTDQLYLPKWLVIGIAYGIGYGLGWPIGKILHRSGYYKLAPPAVLAAIATLIMLLVGDLLLTSTLVYQHIGHLAFDMIFANLTAIITSGGVIKVMCIVATAVSVAVTTTPKKVELKI